MCACACMCVCVCACVILDEVEREAYERTYWTTTNQRVRVRRTIGHVGCSTAASENAQSRRIRLALLKGPPRRGDARAPIHCPAEDYDGLSTQAAPHCASGAKAAVPRPERESVRFPQPMDGLRTPEVLGTVCATMLGCACIAANVGRPSDRTHRLHTTSIDPAVRNAAGCGP